MEPPVKSIFGKVPLQNVAGIDWELYDEMVCLDCKEVLKRAETLTPHLQQRHLVIMAPVLHLTK